MHTSSQSQPCARAYESTERCPLCAAVLQVYLSCSGQPAVEALNGGENARKGDEQGELGTVARDQNRRMIEERQWKWRPSSYPGAAVFPGVHEHLEAALLRGGARERAIKRSMKGSERQWNGQ